MLKRKPKIIFTDSTRGGVDPLHKPVPAKKELPDWYKNMKSYITENDPGITFPKANDIRLNEGSKGIPTIKRCMPVFDSITSGYFIKLPVDVIVFDHPDEEQPWYRWADGNEVVRFHDYDQVEGYPFNYQEEIGRPVAKFKNFYGIITPPGYSCWFKTPSHRNLPFTLLEGTVDTDVFHAPVEFPFLLNDPNWRGLIPAGTPIAQVIPYKRDSFTHEIQMETEDFKPSQDSHRRVRTIFDNGYRNLFWYRKSYD